MTPISTQLEFFIQPLAEYGGVDLFMYIQVDPRSNISTNASLWDGHLDSFEPTIGDTTMCDLYGKDAIFANNTGNNVFCLVEFEHEISNPSIDAYGFWASYSFVLNGERWAKEQLLQQLYGTI